MEDIKLKVMESYEEYVGKNIVSLNIILKEKLNIMSGDVIEISGQKTTAAQVWPDKHRNDNENIIRMDQYIRRNAGVAIGDFISLKKINPVNATSIELSSLKEIKLPYDNFDLVVKKNFLGRPFSENDIIVINIFGTAHLFLVNKIFPNSCALLSEATSLVIKTKPKNKNNDITESSVIGYEDVGGLKTQIEVVREMIELPFKYPDFFKKLNISPPKGILLYGPPGTGKTLIAKAISNELNAKFISIDGPEIMQKYVGEAEEKIRKIFKLAEKNEPAIIFIDEIDAITPKRENTVNEVEKRVVGQLLACMDGVSERGAVIVIGATNRIHDIDIALRRPGRFDREIEISPPSEDGRLDILKIHTRNVPLSKNVSLKKIAKKTHGYVGADLSALVKEAGIYAIKNAVKKIKTPKKEEYSKILNNLKINMDDLLFPLNYIQPSALREVFVETPTEQLIDVGGVFEQKQIIKDIIEVYLNKKELLKNMGISIPKNILLYGPPGTGKTMFVKACAKTYGINFIYVKGPEILNKWIGESEKTIREIFKKAKSVSPSILCFDEIDSLSINKDMFENKTKVLDQLLIELDNLSKKDVIFMACTNRPDLIDSSLLRSGRIDKMLEFKLPSKEERKDIFKVLLKDVPCKKINFSEIIDLTEGFSGADINLLITEATLLAIKENNYKETKLDTQHLLKILKKLKPTVSKEQLMFFDSFRNENKIANYIL